ncbi:MAG TPA: hypothetical protein VD978_16620 [Azospirillum sp.]|nr:hypothetical protein [Azospirillum sp.]
MTSEKKDDLISAGNIAKELGLSDSKVKKAIKDLDLQPAAKRGVCNFYSRNDLDRIKAALQAG